MPRISEFYGIVIKIYYRNEHLLPHFHAEYAGVRASFAIADTEKLAGEMPLRALRLVREWASLHRAELLSDWELARARRPLVKIEPLP